MALDPNGCEFWETGEYYATTGLNHQTRIGSFHFPGCTTVGNGTLSGTVTDGANPIQRRDRQPRQPDGDDGRERCVLVHRPGRHVLRPRRRRKAGLRPGLGRDARRPRRRHAHAELHAQRGRPERLLHRQLAEHLPARRAERLRPRREPGQRAARERRDIDQPNTTVTNSGFGVTNTSWAGQTFTPTRHRAGHAGRPRPVLLRLHAARPEPHGVDPRDDRRDAGADRRRPRHRDDRRLQQRLAAASSRPRSRPRRR